MAKKYILKNTGEKPEKSSSIDYEKELNKSQLEAVNQLNGPVLVIAGAGSGKTRTLVYRVARLVEEGVDPQRILLLTFTRKAAREMIRKSTEILDDRCGKVAGGTFHSFGNYVLRKYADLAGFNRNFTIFSRSDSEDVINLIRTQMGLRKSKERFPRKKTIFGIISKSINKEASLGATLKKDYPHYLKHLANIEKVYEEYKKYKKSRNVMDYDDLLVYLRNILRENKEVREKLSRFYKYVMIDEYQDTNKLQANIARLLASAHQNIMAVGDDSQSIYSFRGANFRNIMDFPKLFPDTRIITIEQNYRSTQPILDLTNKIIENAGEKYSKSLFTNKKSDQCPIFVETQNENYQSKFVAQRILELREQGVSLSDIAVLFRQGWSSNDLEMELSNKNIPFEKYGGFKFIETAHIKDVVAYLRIANNILDSVSWHRALLLIEGIGTKSANEIISGIVGQNKGIEFLRNQKFKNKKYFEELKKLYSVLKSIFKEDVLFSEKIDEALKYYGPLLEANYDDFDKRKNDLDSLAKIAQKYNGLEKFLSDMTLEPIETSQVGAVAENKEEEKLVLSTIHSAKGMEWHSVFVISAVDGYIPSSYSLDSEEEVEEERRLLYVATTRAKENLYIIKPELEYSGGSFNDSFSGISQVSRFLEEGDILEDYTEKWWLDEEES